ncbi:nucleoside triphosphate pyrophosphohydrolase [Amylibacter marinus]|uniref:Nucleoside triphosphate pyrophosphohydrolase n=2 Tax=Amylibacter marinus TaxID=1475483 RepID=A0ABQ5VSF6_9RHOB|nr:nucleoside triphosphate pyrophosphohydrolase [Amylibacter marinus]
MNRVFDSSGPEGKVRGTPQQIIDKYQALARDAQLAGDRVAHENFLQHAEHYSRLLSDSQREIAARKEAQQAQQAQNQNTQQNAQPKASVAEGSDQPVIAAAPDQEVFPGESQDSDLVSTPESAPTKKKNTRRPARKPAATKAQPDQEQPALALSTGSEPQEAPIKAEAPE